MSHVLRVGQPDQIAYFRAYNTDGSANTNLTDSTTGLTLSVFRVGLLPTSILTLSNKAADNTAHSDGAIRNVGGNLYTIDIPDAACATQCPSICVRGSYTGGVIEGLEHPIVAYDPSVVAVGANTTTPPTSAAIADAVLTESVPDHRSVNNSLAKFIWQIRNANLTIEGTVSNAIAPTTLTFSSNVSATTSAYAHAVLLFVSGPLTGENSPIISYNNTNGVFVLEEPLTAAPSDGDEFVVIAGSHVHSIADIAAAIDITVAPLQATAPNRVAGTEVVTYINDTSAIGPIVVTDGDGDAVDLSALTLKVCVEKVDGTVLANITPSISGAGNNQVTFTPTSDCVVKTGTFRWSLRKTSNNQVYALGDFVVDPAARISS